MPNLKDVPSYVTTQVMASEYNSMRNPMSIIRLREIVDQKCKQE